MWQISPFWCHFPSTNISHTHTHTDKQLRLPVIVTIRLLPPNKLSWQCWILISIHTLHVHHQRPMANHNGHSKTRFSAHMYAICMQLFESLTVRHTNDIKGFCDCHVFIMVEGQRGTCKLCHIYFFKLLFLIIVVSEVWTSEVLYIYICIYLHMYVSECTERMCL